MMDPTIADSLEALRQAGAFMPGTLPATGFGFPNLATLPRDANSRSDARSDQPPNTHPALCA
jgi:hypothetical protein